MMKKHFGKIILGAVFLVVALSLPTFLFAGGGPGEDPDAPIDGGLSLLLAAGVGYGVKKYRDIKKQSQNENEAK